MSLTLKQVPVGKTCTVTGVGGEGAIRRRLFDMGITPNTVIKVVKVAPLGDPVEINIRGYALTLRKAEADAVLVEEGGAANGN